MLINQLAVVMGRGNEDGAFSKSADCRVRGADGDFVKAARQQGENRKKASSRNAIFLLSECC
jgi:hypothetical protein